MIKLLCLAAALSALPFAAASADTAVPSLSNAAAFAPQAGPVGRGSGHPGARLRVVRYDDGCRAILREGAFAPHCVMGFHSVRSSGKSARVKPSILGNLTAFQVGGEKRFAVGMQVPGLIDTLRAGRMVSQGALADNSSGKGLR